MSHILALIFFLKAVQFMSYVLLLSTRALLAFILSQNRQQYPSIELWSPLLARRFR
jgi:hypothetical protein